MYREFFEIDIEQAEEERKMLIKEFHEAAAANSHTASEALVRMGRQRERREKKDAGIHAENAGSGNREEEKELKKEAEEKTAAVRKYLLDEKTGLFVSGEEKQINYASQVWLILAGAVSVEEGSAMLDKLDELKPEKGMVSPYMNHHYVEALLMCGKKDQAMDYMKYYWGGMINHGADTFWELYNPENPAESPYGSSIVNSYCHAWSCTPTYLLRKYFN